MKKKPFSRTTSLLGRIINIKYWSDWDRIKASFKYLGQGFVRFLFPEKKGQTESFDSATVKWDLTDQELNQRQKALFRLSLLMILCALLLFSYSMYHLYYGHLMAFVLSLIVTGIALVLAFRYHYWQYLIKHRKLNSSVQEWYKKALKGENNE